METKVGYYHKRLDTGEIFYVGIGTPSRPYEDKHRNNHWNHIVDKFGYEVIVIKENISWEDACEWEISEIQRIGRRDLGLGPLVNMTDGGEGTQGVLITEERRVNISLATKEAMSNPEVKKRLSESHLGIQPWNTGLSVFVGEENPNFGNTWSDEQKTQLSEKLKETYKDGFSDEHIENLKEGRKGKKPALGMKHSEESKRKMSESHTGQKRSEETKLKMSLSQKGKTQPKLTCPHCGKIGGTTMHRWHFDKCKKNNYIF